MNYLGMSGFANQKPLGTVWHRGPPRLSVCMQGTFQTFHPGESGLFPLLFNRIFYNFQCFWGNAEAAK